MSRSFIPDPQSFFWRTQSGEIPAPRAARTLGIRILEVDAEAGTIAVEFEATAAFANPAGDVQGGFLAAMLDDTMGPALAATLAQGEFAPTLNLQVAYLKPAKVGKIQGFGRIVQRGKELAFLAGELRQSDALIATATATAAIRRATRPTDIDTSAQRQ